MPCGVARVQRLVGDEMMHVDLAWYFLDDHGQEQGPVRGSKLRQWIQCGSISQDFRVRLLNWDGYSSVQELWPNSEVAFLLPPDIYGPTGSSRWGGYKHNQGQIIVERHAVNLEQFVETADKADAADKAEKSAEKTRTSGEVKISRRVGIVPGNTQQRDSSASSWNRKIRCRARDCLDPGGVSSVA